jgi:hypothetical protein
MKQIKSELSRELSLFHITMIGIGTMIGAGVFVSTGNGIGVAGPGGFWPVPESRSLGQGDALSSKTGASRTNWPSPAVAGALSIQAFSSRRPLQPIFGKLRPGKPSFLPVGRRGEKPGNRWRKTSCKC